MKSTNEHKNYKEEIISMVSAVMVFCEALVFQVRPHRTKSEPRETTNEQRANNEKTP